MISPELQNRIAQWRAKAIDNTLTVEEMREAVIIMRESRHAASISAAKSAKASRTKAPAKTADELLGELGL